MRDALLFNRSCTRLSAKHSHRAGGVLEKAITESATVAKIVLQLLPRPWQADLRDSVLYRGRNRDFQTFCYRRNPSPCEKPEDQGDQGIVLTSKRSHFRTLRHGRRPTLPVRDPGGGLTE